MSFVLFYTLFWMFNVLFYVIGYNSRHLNKKGAHLEKNWTKANSGVEAAAWEK